MKKKCKILLRYTAYLLLFLCFNLFVARLSFVSGSSMLPTLKNRDCLLLWQLAYQPKPGDIVITDTENPLSSHLVKRVIAVSGQHVQLKGTQVFVDGERLDESYLGSSCTYADLDLIVPENSVFLMGDNRGYSKDSREIGCLSRDHIMGKVLLRFFPFTCFFGS